MKKHVFGRFIFIYLSFYLCVLIVGMPIYFFSYNKLEESEVRNVSQMVESGSYTMDNAMNSILNIRDATYNNADYRRMNRADPVKNSSLFSQLSQIQSNFTALWNGNNLVSDAGLLFADKLVLTKYRNYYGIGLKEFYGNYFTCENYDYDQWMQKIDEKLPMWIFPSENYVSNDYGRYHALLFVSTWSGFKSGKNNIFYATINTDDLIRILVPDEMIDSAYLIIKTPGGDTLYSYNYDEKTEYAKVNYITSTFNLRVSVGFPKSIVSSRLLPLRKIFYIIIATFVLLGILLSLYWAYYSSKPIGKIVRTLDGIQKPDFNDKKQNPYTYISDSLYKVGERLTNYEQVLQIQSEIIRSNVFERALQSRVLSDEEVFSFERSFPEFPKEYQLAMLKLPSNEDLSFEELCQRQLTCLSKLDLVFSNDVYKLMYHENSIILLLPSIEKEWTEKLMEFHKLLYQSMQWNIKIAISDKFSGISNLPDACSQIRSLLHCEQDNEIVLSMDNYHMRYAFLAIDYGKSQQLFTALEEANVISVAYIFSDICSIISASGYIQESAVQKVFDDFRDVLVRMQFEYSTSLSELNIPIFNAQESYVDNFNQLKQSCIYACNQLEVEKKNKEKNKEREILHYIKCNINDSMLNAREVALHFNTSESYLQKIIKEESGVTFFYFVENLRLDKAVELLQTTTIPINEIYNMCGFASHNSFYKSFKRKYEKSPSQVRNGEQVGQRNN